MKEAFKPDFGIYVKENLPAADVIQFVNLSIKNILRISPKEYSLFTNHIFEEVEYVVSLDFPLEGLADLVQLIESYFDFEEFEILIDKLLDPSMKDTIVEWSEPIDNICCSAILGDEVVNSNESYIPFLVEKFY